MIYNGFDSKSRASGRGQGLSGLHGVRVSRFVVFG